MKFQRKKPLTIAIKGLCGAGEGNRTLDVSLGSSSFAIKLHLRMSGSFLCRSYSIPQNCVLVSWFLFGNKFGVDGADGLFEVCRFNADYDVDLARALIEHADINVI